MGVVRILATSKGVRTPESEGLRNPGNFCLWPNQESLALGFGIEYSSRNPGSH